MDKQIQVSITPGTVITTIIVGALAYALWVLRDLALLVLTAIVIASAIEPGVSWFVNRKIPRVIAVLSMYVLVFGSLFAFVYFFVPPLLTDASNFIAVGAQYLDTFNLSGSDSAGALAAGGQAQLTSMLDGFIAVERAFVDPSAGAFKILSSFFGGIFALVLVTILSFYFAMQDTGIEEFLKLITPHKHEQYVVGLWRRAQRKIGLWLQGQLLSSLVSAVVAYLGLLILGVPYALLLAAFTAVAGLIPIFGSFISAAPAVIIAYSTTGDLTLAAIVAGLFLIINLFEAHLIHPLVVNKIVGIPPLLVILALIVGGQLAGFLGVLLAIPVAAALREFLADMDRGKRARAQAS